MSEVSNKLNILEKDVTELKLLVKRNQRSSGWRGSIVRIATNAVMLYLVFAVLLYLADVVDFVPKALIPTVIYTIHLALVLPITRRWWSNRR